MNFHQKKGMNNLEDHRLKSKDYQMLEQFQNIEANN